MPFRRIISILAFTAVLLLGVHAWPQGKVDEHETLKVGLQPDGRIVVPTNQILKPAGVQVTFPGRPVDLALAEDGKILVVKNMRSLVFIDIATGKVKQTLASPIGFSVVGLAVHDETVYVSDAQNHLRIAKRQADGSYQWADPIELVKPKDGKGAHPAGIALVASQPIKEGELKANAETLWVTSTRGNNVQLVNLKQGQVQQVVPVGVAPYMISAPKSDRLYVSNWGGDPPNKGDATAKSSGTDVRIDPKTGIANQGTVSILDPAPGRWQQSKTIQVGLHPSGMALSANRQFLYVANANSDTISVVDTQTNEVKETIVCRPEARLPFGSGTNAIVLSPDQKTLYVANGTNNCLAVVRLGSRSTPAKEVQAQDSKLVGLIPTGWYPGAIVVSADGKKLFIANVKGIGALSLQQVGQKEPRPEAKGRNSHDHLGSVSIIDVPDDAQLAKYTAEVNANNRLAYSVAGLEKPRPGVKPVPVPVRHGEPSVIEYVIYVIKENRTYDQVFGDMKEGNGDPKLCIFGENVTPNHHALARQFTLFDNFYCSGVLSADGHQWVNEAYVTDYLEKAFGGFTRSYPYDGADPLAYASSGFLWDNALARKKTLRNYGEFAKTVGASLAAPVGGEVKDTKTAKLPSWTDVFTDFKDRTGKFKFDVKANIHTLEPYTHPGYPSFVMSIPDVYRARVFIDELQQFEKKGQLPNLIYLFLPTDHTSGTNPGLPTPAAMVADNDLALGRVVEAVSKSKFWPKTCIFVVEDDPQNGFDHVDGHRTVALVISPYTKRKFVDHTNYNQTGMVKTIELILGLPPMNQLDLSATAMRNCFQPNPDLTPYNCVPNQIALDQMNPPLKVLNDKARYWAEKSLALDFSDADLANEDTLNRILWHAVKGYDVRYPEEYVGAKD
jgi:YVTN family beta-propeller protein